MAYILTRVLQCGWKKGVFLFDCFGGGGFGGIFVIGLLGLGKSCLFAVFWVGLVWFDFFGRLFSCVLCKDVAYRIVAFVKKEKFG